MWDRPDTNTRKVIMGVGSLLIGVLFAFDVSFAADPAPDSSGKFKQRKVPSTYHATAYVRGSMGIRVIDYWSRGSSMRARTMIAGHPILTLVHGDRYVSIDLMTRQGVSIRRPPNAMAQDAKRVRPFAFELDDVIAEGGEKIEEMEIGGVKAEIWQVRDARGRRKVWVASNVPRVPLRVETFTRALGDTHQLDYSNWIFELDLPADFFLPPAGMQVETYEYDVYSVKAAAGSVPQVPILYPDLLHGFAPN